jgi:hypothetical protein
MSRFDGLRNYRIGSFPLCAFAAGERGGDESITFLCVMVCP